MKAQIFFFFTIFLVSVSVVRGLLSAQRTANAAILRGLKVGEEVASRILDNPRMIGVDLPSRIAELRESVGLTRPSLKHYLAKYPDVCVGLFADRVKTNKSVIMRIFKVTEQEYEEAVKRISKQTNNKAGVLFRGSFPFIVASLRDQAGFLDDDLSFLFKQYPTIFTLDYKTVAGKLEVFRYTLGYSQEQLRLLLLRNCRSALCGEERALALRNFFLVEFGFSSAEFCELTVEHPRLFGVSLSKTLQPKLDHLVALDAWGIPRERLHQLIKRAPSVLTTPAETTRKLWQFLSVELHLSQEAAQTIVRKYPNLLRVNSHALDIKLRALTLAQISLMLDLLPEQKEKKEQREAEDEEGSSFRCIAERLYADVAAALLTRAPVALTCSIERIESRMRALGSDRGIQAAAKTHNSKSKSKSKSKRSGTEAGGESIADLLDRRIASLEALAAYWSLHHAFPVPPSIITISDTKFNEKLKTSSL